MGEIRDGADQGISILLIGNKNDLEDQREVTRDKAEEYAVQEGIQYLETSAMTSDNVDQAFLNIVNSTQYTIY